MKDEGTGIHEAFCHEEGVGIHARKGLGEVALGEAAEDDGIAFFIIGWGGFWDRDGIVHHAIMADEGDEFSLAGVLAFGEEVLDTGFHFVASVGVGDEGGFPRVVLEFKSDENGAIFRIFGLDEFPFRALFEVRREAIGAAPVEVAGGV